MILYLHGFNSSPKSLKAQQTQSYFAQHFPQINVLIPKIPCYPLEALNFIEELFLKNQKFIKGVVGSSLGGYLASYLVEKYSVKSVLINPAVYPYELLEDYLGWQTNPYTNESFELTQRHMAELKSFDTPIIQRHEQFWLLQQLGDEVLDPIHAIDKYHGCKQTVEAGGDHSFQGYEQFLPQIAEFFAIKK